MRINPYKMLDCQLDPPCKEPDPEHACSKCNLDMKWIEDENLFECLSCEEFITWDQIQRDGMEGTYDF